MGEGAEHPLRAPNFVLGAVAILATSQRRGMRQAVIADPVALGVSAFGAGAALRVGELLSDHKKRRAHAFGAEHVEDVVGYFGLGTVVEAERDLHFTSPIPVPLWPITSPANLHRRHVLAAAWRLPAYFFCSIGAPQHLSAPTPPLVTIT